MKKEKFKEWLIASGYKESTATNYSYAIDSISKHLSINKKEIIDVYSINELDLIENIVILYSIDGIYSEFGHRGKGTIRNGIKMYLEYQKDLINN